MHGQAAENEEDICPIFKTAGTYANEYMQNFGQSGSCILEQYPFDMFQSYEPISFQCESMNQFQEIFTNFNGMRDMNQDIPVWNCRFESIANQMGLNEKQWNFIEFMIFNQSQWKNDYLGSIITDNDSCYFDTHHIVRRYLYTYGEYLKCIDGDDLYGMINNNININVNQKHNNEYAKCNFQTYLNFIELNKYIVIESRKGDPNSLTSFMFRNNHSNRHLRSFMRKHSKRDPYNRRKRSLNITVIGISSGEDVISLYYQICKLFEKKSYLSKKKSFYNIRNWEIHIYSIDVNIWSIEIMKGIIKYGFRFPCKSKEMCQISNDINDYLFYSEYRKHIVLEQPIWSNVARIEYEDEWYVRGIIENSQYIQAQNVVGQWINIRSICFLGNLGVLQALRECLVRWINDIAEMPNGIDQLNDLRENQDSQYLLLFYLVEKLYWSLPSEYLVGVDHDLLV